MRYIKFTYVDAQTGICVNKAPTRNGPKFPEVKGLQYLFALESNYPTDVPEFFGLCDDDADVNIDGCFGEITEAEFIARTTRRNKRSQTVSIMGVKPRSLE
jgi:hypothetical protein